MPPQKVGYEKKTSTATILIAVSLALAFPLSLSFSSALPFRLSVMCVIQFKLFPNRWQPFREGHKERESEIVRLVY